MKLLLVSTDTKIFEKNTSVHQRFAGFGSLADEVHVVIVRPTAQREIYHLSENIFVYPVSSHSTPYCLLKGFFVCLKLIKKIRGDWLISTQDPFEQGYLGLFLSLFSRTPLHVQVHTDFLSPFFSKNSLLNKVRSYLAGPVLRHARGIRVVAQHIKESIILKFSIHKDKIDVLPVFIDTKKTSSTSLLSPIEGKYFLYVGRFEKEKNVPSLIKAFSLISEDLPNIRLVLLGSGSLETSYKFQIKSLGLSDKVLIIPWSNDVNSFMSHAEVLILPSWFEGFPLVLVEAILNNCPVIVTHIGAVGGIVPIELVRVFEQDNSLELSDKMKYVTENRDHVRKDTAEAKEYILKNLPINLDEYVKTFKHSLTKAKYV